MGDLLVKTLDKKSKLVSGAAVGLVALLVVYFVAVPSTQVGSYKETVAKRQSELNESVNKLGAVLERDTFVKSDVEVNTIRNDVKVGNEAVKDVEAKLATVKGELTGFNALPLLSSVNGDYKTAAALNDDEKAYIAKTEAFVAEVKGILTYFDKTADLTTKFEEFGTAITKAEDAETAVDYANQVDAVIKALQPAVDEVSKINAPASLRESHEYSVKAVNELLDLYKQSAAAARADDMDKLEALDAKIVAKAEEIFKKTDDYNAKFIRESELRKLDDALNELDREISRKQASL